MKIFLVTRGSQGDVYPYLGLAETLVNAGHEIFISIPKEFEKQAAALKLNFILQSTDDITGVVNDSKGTKDLLKWMQRIIEQQFTEFIPIVKEYDIFIASNTEFAAPHIAEYCGKPIIRTGYAPLLPSSKIFPAVFPIINPPAILRPRLLWSILNLGLNLMMLKSINKLRSQYGMKPIKNQGEYAPSHADNFLMYSPTLAEIDEGWKYRWHAGGYCFNDTLPYDKDAFTQLENFVKKDSRPTVFFSLGSCTHKNRDIVSSWLLDICKERGYKLVVGSGWFKTGGNLSAEDNLFLQRTYLPHNLVMPLFDAIIHHGGAGTSHSAARSGRPQLILPILIDQFYYATRTQKLGVSPGSPKHFKKLTRKFLERQLVKMIEDPIYKKNAEALAVKINAERGLDAMHQYIEKVAISYHENGYSSRRV
ncbi:MAG: glycosyltransferase [Termitinemataceae bacterium]|nr:MAG: glycosyltransferase [Termitinemataceae bacterium]